MTNQKQACMVIELQVLGLHSKPVPVESATLTTLYCSPVYMDKKHTYSQCNG